MASSLIVGWREWGSLPELAIPHIKMKVDTGARTSALHAFRVESLRKDGKDWIRFFMHPIQKDSAQVVESVVPLLEYREVSDSGGHRELRPVILTKLVLGPVQRRVEITLTDRENMKFRMLLGRTALEGLLIRPDSSFLFGGNWRSPP